MAKSKHNQPHLQEVRKGEAKVMEYQDAECRRDPTLGRWGPSILTACSDCSMDTHTSFTLAVQRSVSTWSLIIFVN